MAKRKIKTLGIKRFLSFSLVSLTVVLIAFCSFYPIAFVWVRNTYHWIGTSVNNFMRPALFSFELEHIYSASLKHKILEFLEQELRHVNLLFFHPSDFYINIKKNFDIIKKISWERVSINMVRFSVVGVQPYYKLNDEYVVAENKKIYHAHFFAQYPLDKLNTVYVNKDWIQPSLKLWPTGLNRVQPARRSHLGEGGDDNKKKEFSAQAVPDDLFQLLKQVPFEVWQAFTLHYHGKHEIFLKPKRWLTKSVLIVDDRVLSDQKKRLRLTSILQDLIDKKIISEKKIFEEKSLLAFDMRFTNRVIVKIFEGKRGRGA